MGGEVDNRKSDRCSCCYERSAAAWFGLVIVHLFLYGLFSGILVLYLYVAYNIFDKNVPQCNINNKNQAFLQIPGISLLPKTDHQVGTVLPTFGYDPDNVHKNHDEHNVYTRSHIKEIGEFLDKAKKGGFMYRKKVKGEVCKDNKVECPTKYTAESFGNCKPPNYGWDSNSPCIIFSLNRIYGWVPKLYDSEDELPSMFKNTKDSMKTKFTKGKIPISCTVKKDYEGKSFEGTLDGFEFYPQDGIDGTCYPFCGADDKKTYINPFVVIKVKGLSKYKGDKSSNTDTDSLVGVECHFWTKNSGEHNWKQQIDMVGSVIFTFKMIPSG